MKNFTPLALCAILLLTACSTPAAQTEVALVAVQLAAVDVGNIETITPFNGKINADTQVAVSAKIPGIVLSVTKKIGDTVTAGEVLATIDGTDLQHQLRQLDAQIAQTQAGVAVSQSAVNIVDQSIKVSQAGTQAAQANLSRTQGSNEQSLAAAKSNLENARKGLDSAQIAYDNLLTNYNNTKALFDAGAASRQSLENLESQLQTSKITLDNAQRTVDDLQKVLDLTSETLLPETEAAAAAQVVQSDAQSRQVESQRNQAQAQVAQAQAGLQTLLAQRDGIASKINDLRVTSPISGVVAEKNINAGETAGVAPLFSITNMSGVIVETIVTERVITSIAVNDSANVFVKALGDEMFVGTVEYISPQISAQAAGYSVRVRLDNSDNKLKGGMLAKVDFVTEQKADVIRVPLEAIVSKNGVDTVYVCENEQVKLVEIKVGSKNQTHAQVVEGLEVGQQVVVKGQTFIADGQKVNPVD